MSGTEARQVLRALLRAVDRNITGATGNRQWREFVIAEFRRGEQLADPAERERALQQARDYAFLIHSVREHKVRARWSVPAHTALNRCPLPVAGWATAAGVPLVRCFTFAIVPAASDCGTATFLLTSAQELLLSYNIGIPVERREKDMNVRAANMVGLQFPKLE